LLALSIGALASASLNSPMSLLPVIATDLGVSIPAAGPLISAYALGVVIRAPLVTATTAAWRDERC
jgi:DHA1 family inner membrane transport protein